MNNQSHRGRKNPRPLAPLLQTLADGAAISDPTMRRRLRDHGTWHGSPESEVLPESVEKEVASKKPTGLPADFDQHFPICESGEKVPRGPEGPESYRASANSHESDFVRSLDWS